MEVVAKPQAEEQRRPAPTAETPRPAPRPQPPVEAAKPQAERRPAPERVAIKPQPAAAPSKPAAKPKPARPEQYVWSFPDETESDQHRTGIRNAPAVDAQGRVFLTYQDRLVALVEEEKKPKVLWEYVTGNRAPGPVVLGPQDTLRLHCTDGYLHCLDAATGKQVWSPACVGEPLGYAVPVVDQDGNTWISHPEGGLVRVDSMGRTQKPGPYFRSRQKFDSPGLISGGVLYVNSEHGYIFAIDISGERGVNRWNQAADQGYVGVVHSAPAMTPDGVLVAVGPDETLYGVSRDGAIAFKTPMPGQMLGSLVFDRFGHIYVGVSQTPRGMDPRGVLVCVDGNSHKVRWEFRTPGPVESTPVIGDDDMIYFGDNAGFIYCVNFLGREQWKAQAGSAVRSAGAILGAQRVAFGLDNETMMVLECSSGGLAAEGWPKVGRTLGQNGMT